MERYLGSGLIKGIGPIFARRLVVAFGEAVFETIESAPKDCLGSKALVPSVRRGLPPAGPIRRSFARSWRSCKAMGLALHERSASSRPTAPDAIPLVTENPYRLARDIAGIGFKSADLIAERLGIAKTAMIRARAGIVYALMEAIADGHCGLPEDQLLTKAEKLLEIPNEILAEALLQEIGKVLW